MIRRFLTSLGLAAYLLAGSAVSQADPYTWTGGAGNLLWREADNWTPSGFPPMDSTIVFAGATLPGAQVPAGSTVDLAGLPTGNDYPYREGTTQVWLNNGAGFEIDIRNQYTYWHTIEVQDAYDYVITTNTRLGLLRATDPRSPNVVDVVSGGSLTLDRGLIVSGFATGTLKKTGDGMLSITGDQASSSTVNLVLEGGIFSMDRVDPRPDNYNRPCSLTIRQGATFQYTGAGAESKTRSLNWDNGDAAIEITKAAANLTIDVTGGDLSSGGGLFTKKGPGTLTLATSDVDIDFGKPITVSSGTLALQANETNGVRFESAVTGVAGTTLAVLQGTGTVGNQGLTADWSANLASLDVAADATFDLGGNRVQVAGLTGAGSIINSSYQANSGIEGHTLTVGLNDTSSTFSGIISGTGTTIGAPGQIALLKTGAGTLTLTGKNTYTGKTTIDGGTLELKNVSDSRLIYQGSDIEINNGSTFRVTRESAAANNQVWFTAKRFIFDSHGGGTIDTTSSMNMVIADDATLFQTTGGATNSIVGASGLNLHPGHTITFEVAPGFGPVSDLTISTRLWNNGAIKKTGAGTLTLTSNNNTYTGGTTVENGTLLVNNTSGSGTGTGVVVVRPNGELGGTGIISGATTIESRGTLAPGASVGTLSFLDTLTLKNGSVWNWEFEGAETPGEFSYDQVVGPRLDLDGIVTLNIYGDASLLTAGESRFTLFTGDVYDDATLLAPGQDANHLFEIIDHTNWWGDWEVTGGSLVLTAVPEPGSVVMMVFGILSLWWMGARRRRF